MLQSVDATHPQLEAADRTVDEAKGKRLAARGAWDPTLSVGSRWSPIGFYSNGQVDAVVRQATPLWGIGAFAGYRLGWGAYPLYKGELQTLSGGEVRAGIDVPVWRDGPIDDRRAQVKSTKALAKAADCGRVATRLTTQQAAASAYWRWVATGLEVRIQEDLLDVAQRRDQGLREQAAAGGIPAITVVDNERLVLDRESKLVSAKRDFQRAVLKLSLHLRDDRRRPVRAGIERVPPSIPEVAVDLPEVKRDVQGLAAAPSRGLQASPRTRGRRRERPPQEEPAGAGGSGSGVRRPRLRRRPGRADDDRIRHRADVRDAAGATEGEGGVPGGEGGAAQRIGAQLRAMQDRIGADVRAARVDLAAAQAQVDLATRQLKAAQALADAEREKFKEGASNLVIVNLRELAAADAARLEVEARAAHQKAQADYLAASGRGL